MKLSGAVAVVVGGACDIGKEYCRVLLQQGAKVMSLKYATEGSLQYWYW